jgi:drug/metabolite transporter (DMT)-like permease
MKFSNGTEFHFGRPKYKKVSDRLGIAGIFLIFLSRNILPSAPGFVSGIGFLMILAALIVLLFGTIAERKEWEAKRKIETE